MTTILKIGLWLCSYAMRHMTDQEFRHAWHPTILSIREELPREVTNEAEQD